MFLLLVKIIKSLKELLYFTIIIINGYNQMELNNSKGIITKIHLLFNHLIILKHYQYDIVEYDLYLYSGVLKEQWRYSLQYCIY